ncbi:hypothetical protein WICPIJ_007562 [Wickerhamomyces pijperi]|uniref:Uncharacterized protein n=1 Tax=Wickerhamomyces pijperi TaxID=599730 RepID=A0A9P8TJ49_WICPI|nr:hypothetical protein WICPIJ_007562 [Wickerhamomyces pijperi]
MRAFNFDSESKYSALFNCKAKIWNKGDKDPALLSPCSLFSAATWMNWEITSNKAFIFPLKSATNPVNTSSLISTLLEATSVRQSLGNPCSSGEILPLVMPWNVIT